MSPKSKKSKSPERKFLFVNEDASSIFTRDHELERGKQSHVQRNSFARRKKTREWSAFTWGPKAQSKQSRESASITSPGGDFLIPLDRFDSFAQPVSFVQCPDEFSQQFHRDRSESGSSIDLPFDTLSFSAPFEITGLGPSQADLFDVFNRDSHATYHEQTQFFPRPSPQFEISIDPFSNMSIALPMWAPILLQYFIKTITPSMLVLDVRAAPLPQIRHAAAIHNDMSKCFTDPGHLYALLAAISARMLTSEGKLLLPNISEADFLRLPLFFKTKAMHILRQKLAKGLLEIEMLVDFLRLMATARLLRHFDAEFTHFQAVLQMIDDLGGFEALDEYTRERVVICCILSSLQTLTPPKALLEWDPGPCPIRITRNFVAQGVSTAHSFGTGFMELAVNEILGKELTGIIMELVELVQILLLTKSSGSYSADTYSWLAFRRGAIDHRLLSFSISVDDAKKECIRIALLFWIGQTIGDPFRKVLAAETCNALRETLEMTDLSDMWHPNVNLLLWVSTVGAISAGQHIDYAYFGKLAAGTARTLNLTNAHEFEEALQGFFYLPGIQRDATATLFDHFEDLLRSEVGKQRSSQESTDGEAKGNGKGRAA